MNREYVVKCGKLYVQFELGMGGYFHNVMLVGLPNEKCKADKATAESLRKLVGGKILKEGYSEVES